MARIWYGIFFDLWAVVPLWLEPESRVGEMRPSCSPLYTPSLWSHTGRVTGTHFRDPAFKSPGRWGQGCYFIPPLAHQRLLCFSEEEKHKWTKQLNLLTPASISWVPFLSPPLPRGTSEPHQAGIPSGVYKHRLCYHCLVISLSSRERTHPRGRAGPALWVLCCSVESFSGELSVSTLRWARPFPSPFFKAPNRPSSLKAAASSPLRPPKSASGNSLEASRMQRAFATLKAGVGFILQTGRWLGRGRHWSLAHFSHMGLGCI